MSVSTVIVSRCTVAKNLDDATACATRTAAECLPEVFCNRAVTETATCPDGSVFSYTVADGMYCAESQDEADAVASSVAKQKAVEMMFCTDGGDGLGNNRFACCDGTAFTGLITLPDTAQPYTWSTLSGLPPFGFIGAPLDVAGTQFEISGTSAGAPAKYDWSLQIDSANGSSLSILVSFNILAITPALLADGTVGTAYSGAFVGAGGNADTLYTYEIASGVLPPGLALDGATGIISGVPLVAGTYGFSIKMTATV